MLSNHFDKFRLYLSGGLGETIQVLRKEPDLINQLPYPQLNIFFTNLGIVLTLNFNLQVCRALTYEDL